MDMYRRLPDLPDGPTYGIIATREQASNLFKHARATVPALIKEAAANDFYDLAQRCPIVWKRFLEAKPRPNVKVEEPTKQTPPLTTIVSEMWLFPEPQPIPRHDILKMKSINLYG